MTDPHGLAPESLLSVEEVAELLKVPVSWVYERTRATAAWQPHCRHTVSESIGAFSPRGRHWRGIERQPAWERASHA